MAWKRRHHELYYYRQRWVDGRAVSEYVGVRGAAIRAATLDEMRREGRDSEAAAWRAEAAGLRAEDGAAAGLSAAVDAILALALEASGFHRHKRQWRRRRYPMGELATTGGPRSYIGRPRLRPRPKAEIAEIMAVLRRAAAGDESAMPRARELFEEDPERMIFVAGGEVQRHVEQAQVEHLAGATNLATKEALERKLDALRAELAGPHPSPLERLLAERATTCWLDCHRRDWQVASMEKEGMSLAKSEHYDRLRSRAHARYLSSLKALALVRKLNVTAIQMNIERVEVGIPAPAAATGAPDPPMA